MGRPTIARVDAVALHAVAREYGGCAGRAEQKVAAEVAVARSVGWRRRVCRLLPHVKMRAKADSLPHVNVRAC
jgi:hypothetical protein